MSKVAIYTIAKNESKHVDRWYESAKSADGIFVLDTGSTDNTLECLAKHKDITVFTAEFTQFRFDLARNFILNQIPEDYDWCVFLDMDEVFEENWRELLEEEITTNTTATCFNVFFVYSRTPDGSPDTTYMRTMVHKNALYDWYYPVHELLKCKGRSVEIDTSIKAFHLPDVSKERTQYLPLLELSVQENPNSSRACQYLAREYMYDKQYQRALMFFQKHINIEDSPVLRSESLRYMAECNVSLNQNKLAECCYLRAIAEAPSHREPWGDCADFYHRVKDYESCLGMVSGMLRIHDMPLDSVIRKDAYYSSWPYHMGAVCYHNLKATELAVEYIKEAHNLSPNNPYVLSDYVTITKTLPSNIKIQGVRHEENTDTVA
jgi:glycosyltransferase involved in cell wall biosynthesis